MGRVYSFNVVMRKSFYIVCCKCMEEISGWDRDDVVSEANKRGWVYDVWSDSVYCSSCGSSFNKG